MDIKLKLEINLPRKSASSFGIKFRLVYIIDLSLIKSVEIDYFAKKKKKKKKKNSITIRDVKFIHFNRNSKSVRLKEHVESAFIFNDNVAEMCQIAD